MVKYTDYDIVFQEIPDEVTLSINLSNCPHRCAGCHSPHLQQDIGKELTESTLSDLLNVYENAVTCICFMGGDANPERVSQLASFVRKKWSGKIKTGWYSGSNTFNNPTFANSFNFIKLGAYMEELGGLNKKTTNQRLYKVEEGVWRDITARMSER